MVVALFTLTAGLDRARRQRKDASALSLLQVIGGRDGIRPSEIADHQLVHPSLVTRQVRDLEDAGYVQVAEDPADGRSWLVALTPAGGAELRRLQQVGLDRFALAFAQEVLQLWQRPGVDHIVRGQPAALRCSDAIPQRHEGPPGSRPKTAR